MVRYDHRHAAEPEGVHQARAPGLVATGTQAELAGLQCPGGDNVVHVRSCDYSGACMGSYDS